MGRRGYTNPDAAGYLLEAEACKKVVKELEHLVEKFQRKIDCANAARQAEFETAMQYHSETEIQDAFGWELITEQQYDRYIEIFRNGQEALESHAPTSTELAHQILKRILVDIDLERQEWEFSALTPEQQFAELKKAKQAKTLWKQKIAEIRHSMAEEGGGTTAREVK